MPDDGLNVTVYLDKERELEELKKAERPDIVTHRITAPDGVVHRIDGPRDATQEEVVAQIKKRRSSGNSSYIPVASKEFGGDEDIYFKKHDETVTLPSGSGAILREINQDGSFDAPPKTSSAWDEVVAGTEKLGANMAFVMNAHGLLSDDQVAQYIVDRSVALSEAHKTQPEYMKKLNSELAKSDGVFETVGTLVSNPRAFGRMVMAQTGNSLIPIMTTFAGGGIGFASGGPIGAAVGMAGGAFTGTALTEVGAEIDSLMAESGVDVTNKEELLLALGNDSFMKELRSRADRKGLTVGAVDALFSVFGGKIASSAATAAKKAKQTAEAAGKTTKQVKRVQTAARIKGGAVGTAVDTAGEGFGEGLSQVAEDGSFDSKDVIVEMMSSLVQSSGQTAAAKTFSVAKDVSPLKSKAPKVDQKPLSATEIKDNLISDISEDVGIDAANDIVESYIETGELDVSSFSEEKQAAIESGIDALKPSLDRFRAERQGVIDEGRIREIDSRTSEYNDKIAALSDDRDARLENKKPVKAIDNKINKLLDDVKQMDIERLALEEKLAENGLYTGTEVAPSSDVLLKAKKADDTDKVAAIQERALRKGIRDGVRLARKDGKAGRKFIADIIKSSNLENKAAYITKIADIVSTDQAVSHKNLTSLVARISRDLEKQSKVRIKSLLQKKLKQVRKSGVISTDVANNIEALITSISLKTRSAKTKKRIQKSIDFFATEAGQVELSKISPKILNEMEDFSKKNIEDMTSSDLQGILDEVLAMEAQGAAKLRLRNLRDARVHERRISELEEGSTPIHNRIIKDTPLEKIGAWEQVQNKYNEAVNKARNTKLALNPMDVIFDIFDGVGDYTGANFTIFKRTLDAGHNRYLDLKRDVAQPVIDLVKKHKLDKVSRNRIGVYAALQQDGGKEHLLNSGLTEGDLSSLSLNKQEIEVYELMRKGLATLEGGVARVLKNTYNKTLEKINDYFPFIVDVDAMYDDRIEERFGDDAIVRHLKSNVEKGFTEKRKGSAGAIKIDALDVFLGHVDNAAYLVEMGHEIKALSSVARDERYGDSVGDVGQNIVREWMDLMARHGGQTQKSISAMDTMRKNISAAVLGAKLTSIAVQPTALADGAALIGGKNVLKGSTNITSRAWRDFLMDGFPELRTRVGDDQSFREFGGDGVIEKAQNASFWAMKAVDKLAASAVVSGAYEKYMKENGKEVDLSSPPDPDGVQYAQLMMRRSQASALAKDAPQMISIGKLTGHASVDRWIFQFQTFMLNRWSVMTHDFGRRGVKGGKIKQAVNVATWMMIANMAELGIRRSVKEVVANITGAEIDDWDETIEKDFMMQLLGNVPFVSQTASVLEYGSMPVPAIGYMGRVFETASWAAKTVDEDKKAAHATSAAILAAGMFGVPAVVQIEELIRKSRDD